MKARKAGTETQEVGKSSGLDETKSPTPKEKKKQPRKTVEGTDPKPEEKHAFVDEVTPAKKTKRKAEAVEPEPGGVESDQPKLAKKSKLKSEVPTKKDDDEAGLGVRSTKRTREGEVTPRTNAVIAHILTDVQEDSKFFKKQKNDEDARKEAEEGAAKYVKKSVAEELEKANEAENVKEDEKAEALEEGGEATAGGDGGEGEDFMVTGEAAEEQRGGDNPLVIDMDGVEEAEDPNSKLVQTDLSLMNCVLQFDLDTLLSMGQLVSGGGSSERRTAQQIVAQSLLGRGGSRGSHAPFRGTRSCTTETFNVSPNQGTRGSIRGTRGSIRGTRGTFRCPQGPVRGTRGSFRGGGQGHRAGCRPNTKFDAAVVEEKKELAAEPKDAPSNTTQRPMSEREATLQRIFNPPPPPPKPSSLHGPTGAQMEERAGMLKKGIRPHEVWRRSALPKAAARTNDQGMFPGASIAHVAGYGKPGGSGNVA